VQLTWFPGWAARANLADELAIALHANPAVAWYLRHKCPEVAEWLDRLLPAHPPVRDPSRVLEAELAIMRSMNDLLVYALDPAVYDAQPFLGWDSRELTSLVDFAGKTVIDIGAGTGRLTLVAAATALTVFAVEPVANLRYYLREKSRRLGLRNVYPVDGIMTEIPFPDGFADVTISGHVFGDDPEAECAELVRVTRSGGMVILCPGNNDTDNAAHDTLIGRGFVWSRFEEPTDGIERKYWKAV
jgi:SAM-dependent methyltransferase